MISKESKNKSRQERHLRVRKKVQGTAERPRLSIRRSLRHMYAQIIDDEQGNTLVSASTLEKDVQQELTGRNRMEAARRIGELVATRAREKGIEAVVFDRGGYKYHGKVSALAEGARSTGLRV